eukprot:CAMPEP_0183712450 /NCGR_PEP_ID=MMETSP0737-20130205/7570_1 /TAXON_ID=385413 /ORGANISM="Thalassiosira miniscula, Strain CCMP1093" /LENGTH=132 /DNA_ID=CAMNT_0025941063 /DNA_START=281 /DNA_END=679 /DNA_ORIENTATION=-
MNLRVIFFGSYTKAAGSDGLAAGDDDGAAPGLLSLPELEFVAASPFSASLSSTGGLPPAFDTGPSIDCGELIISDGSSFLVIGPLSSNAPRSRAMSLLHRTLQILSTTTEEGGLCCAEWLGVGQLKLDAQRR